MNQTSLTVSHQGVGVFPPTTNSSLPNPLSHPVDYYPFYFYNYKESDKLLVTFSMGVLN